VSLEQYQEGYSLGENALPPLVDLDILGMTRSLEFSDLKEHAMDCRVMEGPLNTQNVQICSNQMIRITWIESRLPATCR